MLVSDFDYNLPEELIAQVPADKRDLSRMMVLNRKDKTIHHHIFKDIVERAKNCTLEEPGAINLNIEPLSAAWKIDEKDSKCVSKTYRVNCNISEGNYEINLQGLLPENTIVANLDGKKQNTFKIGENFKIMMPIQNIMQSETFTINAKAELKTYPILYGKSFDPVKQNYAITGLVYENKDTSISEDYERNRTKIVVHKQEYGTKIPLQNVEFKLLNEDKEVVKENLFTDKNGEIVLENLLPGKYFLKEIKTLDGYNLYTDYIELNLDLNEEIQVIVNNTKKTTEEINKNYETIEIISDKEEKIINEKNEDTDIVKKETEEKSYEENNYTKNTYVENTKEKKLPKTGF